MKYLGPFAAALLLIVHSSLADQSVRALPFKAQTPAEAKTWQEAARAKLFALMMGGAQPSRGGLDPKVINSLKDPSNGAVLEEITLQTLPDRHVHAWLARPAEFKGKLGAVLALHGHGGSGEQVVRGSGLYWYGRELIDRGYLVIAPDIGQHQVQHTNWSLMGERTWDALRCLDYVATRPEVDAKRLAVAGLSLGGETAMYVAALDERVQAACSSGWLSTVANLKNGHCQCFDFPGLEENFDFSDIFACVAPRRLVCELGEQERAPGGFPVSIGRQAFAEIRAAYRLFNAEEHLVLTVHCGPHVFDGRDFWPTLHKALPRADGGPASGAPVAWVRFEDGPESLEGTPYHWLERSALRLSFDRPPRAGDVLELSWGAKADQREAQVTINGQVLPVQAGGHWGFRWVRVPVPAGIPGDHYEIGITKTRGRPAFLSEVRLTSLSGGPRPPDLKPASYRSKLLPVSAISAAPEAFPEMRRVWDSGMPLPSTLSGDPRRETVFRQAQRNGRLANEALFRCRRYVDGWLAHCDPQTGLFPRNLRESNFWNGRDSAADNYPFMVLTAAITDRPLMEGRLLDILRTEQRLTCRVGRLPDDYSFATHSWRRPEVNMDELFFDGAEYVKDGLLYIAEWLGPSPWSERMTGIIEDIWKYAPVQTPYGNIPTRNFEVSGDLLQASSRIYWFSGDRRFLDWAVRLGDYYLLGTNHPTRDLKRLRLLDHGCEVINGLTELYVAVAQKMPEKKQAYAKPMHDIFDSILEKGRNPDGLLYSWFDPKTGEHAKDLCDTWGYDLDGFYTMWLIDKTTAYREAVRKALSNLKGKYVGACWVDTSADGYADSIEGALNLINREPVASAVDWIDSQTRMMWSIQRADGIIEGWHGDGNFARTSLMYALWKTQGTTLEPWRADVRFGAAREADTIYITLAADQPWKGKLIFDRPRHRLLMHLPLDYTRINQFPEWFTADAKARYQVKLDENPALTKTGEQMAEGIPVECGPGQARLIEVRREE